MAAQIMSCYYTLGWTRRRVQKTFAEFDSFIYSPEETEMVKNMVKLHICFLLDIFLFNFTVLN